MHTEIDYTQGWWNQPVIGCFSPPATIVANKRAKTLLISQFLFHFAEKNFQSTWRRMFVIFSGLLTIIYTTFCTVQQIYYRQLNGKQVQTYFVQLYLYRIIMHVVHVSGYISWTLSKNWSYKKLKKRLMCDSNAHSMDRTASTLTIQPLRLLSVPAISCPFNLNYKLKKCNKIAKLSLALTLPLTLTLTITLKHLKN